MGIPSSCKLEKDLLPIGCLIGIGHLSEGVAVLLLHLKTSILDCLGVTLFVFPSGLCAAMCSLSFITAQSRLAVARLKILRAYYRSAHLWP
jgi:hypothetical protein